MSEPVPEAILWLIFFLPLASFVTITLFLRDAPRLAGLLTVGAVGLALGFSLWPLAEAISGDGRVMGFGTHELVDVGSLVINVGIRLDGLTAVMLVVVSGVSFIVQVYSTGYMRGDGGYTRYFAFMSLFTSAMLGLVLADNLVMLFVFWELVGLASYLLIGFWFHRPAAAAAAKKAFLVTRAGDLGLLAALILIWERTGTLDIAAINTDVLALVEVGLLGQTMLTLFALGLVAGAVGKSAQFPLHIWLPDAMEGPTPVSALIHAATMVVAGVYLLARFFPVLEASATAGRSHRLDRGRDGLGRGAPRRHPDRHQARAGLLHHQPAGVHDVCAGDRRLRGGRFPSHDARFLQGAALPGRRLRRPLDEYVRYAPHGRAAVDDARDLHHVLDRGAVALGGDPLAGFWSKDEILTAAWSEQKVIFAFGLATAGLTAFYMFRVIVLTFHGTYRGGEQPQPGEHGVDPSTRTRRRPA